MGASGEGGPRELCWRSLAWRSLGEPDLEAVARSLIDALGRHGLADPEVRLTTVARIERHTATGKLQRFVALR